MQNHFNLIDEAWIPVADKGLVSLKNLFSTAEIKALGGNPLQKIALQRLLLAIAQAAATPADDNAWRTLGPEGLAASCLAYLEKWHHRFYLYGDNPFLQMPAIRGAANKSFGVLLPEVCTGNTSLLTETQKEKALNDADRALALIGQMSVALGGKKTDNKIVLTPNYQGKFNEKGKASSGKPGVGIAHMGLLHSYWLGGTLWQTLWFNLFTQQDINACPMYPSLGTPPWEQMPLGEDDDIAESMRHTLIGRLLPLNKFCLFTDQGVHYTDGIIHDNYDKGKVDLSVTVDFSQKKPRVLWVNPNKRPWRELTALLQFLQQSQPTGLTTLQLQRTQARICQVAKEITLWSGGLRVTSNAGEQYATGSDDYLQSEITIATATLGSWFLANLQQEMAHLDKLQKCLWACVIAYFRYLTELKKNSPGKPSPTSADYANRATQRFWQLAERNAQDLVNACDQTAEGQQQREKLRDISADYVREVFNETCPNRTSRQMEAWAFAHPKLAQLK